MHKVTDVLVLVVLVALAMVLVRPGSQTADVIRSLGGAFSGAIASATGQASSVRQARARGGRRRA
jgi:hypothetical protein